MEAQVFRVVVGPMTPVTKIQDLLKTRAGS